MDQATGFVPYELFLPELLERPIDVDNAQPERIRDMLLREW